MIRIGIAGATGYTGAELIRLLLNHPHVQITALTSEKQAGISISEAFPSLMGLVDLPCESLKECDLESKCDLIFSALPHKEGMEVVGNLVKSGKKVVDLSADFRLKDGPTYEKWYGVVHTQKDLFSKAVYGLPEIKREQIKNAGLVANPGCYPTGAILGLAPLLGADWMDTSGIIVDSKSGTSGAGRNAGLALLFPECNEGVKAYGIAAHRHIPEINQELTEISNKTASIVFSPHLVPVNRGILSTLYCRLQQKKEWDEIRALYSKTYSEEPFVRILDKGKLANTRHVLGANYCDIGIALDEKNNTAIITTAIDNLMKGASGQAVQNMNLMMEFPEETGLKGTGFFP